ncbi:MAG: transposase [Oligoflexales bacterium]
MNSQRLNKFLQLHVGVDVETRHITALTMTESNVHDSLETDNLIQNTSREIETVTGDKAYDNKHAYDAIAQIKAWSGTPPRSGAALTKKTIWGRCFAIIISETSGNLGENNGKKKLGIMIEV